MNTVLRGAKPLAGEPWCCALREVAAVGEAHAEDGIAGLQQGEQDGALA